ncbi:hypothetical protein C1W90_14180 [Burkholderia pseudomallei]|nr:hypothetical protein [Burkholderia pseudomallei]MBM5587929.1 hypothetical protein [Burkholderia pseudomallei]MBM5620254.1 hypothetical protein [Burkholderia pseudomallei]MBM5624456.1 hypothetical protein [Burkholderia pseudomallei]MBM5633195.1 hypothetical protein [Burkholderia pseudomallei]
MGDGNRVEGADRTGAARDGRAATRASATAHGVVDRRTARARCRRRLHVTAQSRAKSYETTRQ